MLQHFEVRLTHILQCAGLMTHILGGAVVCSVAQSRKRSYPPAGWDLFLWCLHVFCFLFAPVLTLRLGNKTFWIKCNRFNCFQVKRPYSKCLREAKAREVHKEPGPAENPAVQTFRWELSPSHCVLHHRVRHHSWCCTWKMLLWVENFLVCPHCITTP